MEKEGKRARLQELCVHLQTAYRHWQRNKPDHFAGELNAARLLLDGFLSAEKETPLLADNLRVVQLAVEKNQKELVMAALARAVSRAERMLRRA
ncbi:hypothetical protein HYU22_00915 [Candidatus Woesearchaeota archaeon]|nr:hypothetical protein [Candidatus Woesearchaeota archaeon]